MLKGFQVEDLRWSTFSSTKQTYTFGCGGHEDERNVVNRSRRCRSTRSQPHGEFRRQQLSWFGSPRNPGGGYDIRSIQFFFGIYLSPMQSTCHIRSYIIFDNAPSHSKADQEANNDGPRISRNPFTQRLPPDLPFLNIVEMVISVSIRPDSKSIWRR